LTEDKNFKKFLLDESVYETTLPAKFQKRKPFVKPDKRNIIAFIPGLIQTLHVKKGDRVKMGDNLLVLEAMKMRNDLKSPLDGKIKEIFIKEGSVVVKGELLIILE
jgi:biotin carboxyl carrier protein